MQFERFDTECFTERHVLQKIAWKSFENASEYRSNLHPRDEMADVDSLGEAGKKDTRTGRLILC